MSFYPGRSECGHEKYWIGNYGTCMACRAEKAEKDLSTSAIIWKNRAEKSEVLAADLQIKIKVLTVERDNARITIQTTEDLFKHPGASIRLGHGETCACWGCMMRRSLDAAEAELEASKFRVRELEEAYPNEIQAREKLVAYESVTPESPEVKEAFTYIDTFPEGSRIHECAETIAAAYRSLAVKVAELEKKNG